MTLKEQLQAKFRITLPISGGMGTSIEDAIIIHKNEDRNCAQLEKDIIRYILQLKGVEWQMVMQGQVSAALFKYYDKIIVETYNSDNMEIKTMSFYFDINECLKRK
jgi:hypothetical protein